MSFAVRVPGDPLTDFLYRLQVEARSVAKQTPAGHEDYARDSVAEQVGSLLDQIASLRGEHRDLRTAMIDMECEVGTDLLDTEAQRWWYSPQRMEVWRDRQRLLARKASLVHDRLRTESIYRQNLKELGNRLLVLIQRHRALRG